MSNKPTIQYGYDAHGNFRNMTIAEFLNEVPVEGIGDYPLCEQSIMDMRVIIEYLQEKLEKAEELIIMAQGKISAQPYMDGSQHYSLRDPQIVLKGCEKLSSGFHTMTWQDRYHRNLNNGMRDSEAFDEAVEATREEQECYDLEMAKYAESYIAQQYEEYINEHLKEQEKP